MEDKRFKENIANAKNAFAAGAVPTESDFTNLIDTVASAGFTKGMIMMFSGTTAPDGWHLCNGENGTPNLLGRFILAGPLQSNPRRSNHAAQPNGAVELALKNSRVKAAVSGRTGKTLLKEENLPPADDRLIFVDGKANFPHGTRFSARYTLSSDYWDDDDKSYRKVEFLTKKGYSELTKESGASIPREMVKVRDGWSESQGHSHEIIGEMTLKFDDPMTLAPPYYELAFIIKI